MKKIYHDADLTDMPLDSDKTRSPIGAPKTETAKSKINVIKKTSSAKSGGSSTSKSTAKKSSTATKTKEVKEKDKELKEPKTEKKPKKEPKVAEPKKVEEPKVKEKVEDKPSLRSKLKKDSLDNVDLEKLNEESIKSRSFRTRRNRMIIIVLSVLIAIAVATIAIYAGVAILEPNCFTYVHGDSAAVYIINGKELDSFRAPNTIKENRVYKFNAKLKIEESGKFDVKFIIFVYCGGYLVENTAVYESNIKAFYKGDDGYYYSHTPISGYQTVELCKGVDIRNQPELNVNDSNFKMEIHTYITKV